MNSPIKAIIAGIVACIAIFAAIGSYFTVDPGQRAFILTFGKIQDEVYTSGMHFKKPFVDSVVKMDVQTQNFQVDAAAASKDLQNVQTKVSINFNLNPALVKEIYTNIGDEEQIMNRIIFPAVQDSVKEATSKFNINDLITQRDEVRQVAMEALSDRIKSSGVMVTDLNFVNFKTSDAFDQAIEQKMQAEQQALTAKNQLATIQYQADQAVAKAEGDKKAIILNAEAQAEAIKIQSQAIQQNGGEQYVELQRINKWNGQLPNMVTNGTPLLNIK